MNIETIEDLFGYQLQHAYYAERTQIELLSELADETTSDDLERTLTDHRAETEQHVERLEDVFAALGRRPRASRSRTVDGLADARRPDRHGEDPERHRQFSRPRCCPSASRSGATKCCFGLLGDSPTPTKL